MEKGRGKETRNEPLMPRFNGRRFSLELMLNIPAGKSRELALQGFGDVPDFTGEVVEVFPGFHTSVLVTPKKIDARRNLESMEPARRGCMFPSYSNANSSSVLFRSYANANCLFECKVMLARSECGCVPWDFPRWDAQTPGKEDWSR